MTDITITGTPAPKVVKVIDEFTIVMNRGESDGVKAGQRYLIYAIGDELFDPDTKESLGMLEVVRGTGKVTHLQPKMATIVSDMRNPPKRTIRKTKKPTTSLGLQALYGANFGTTEEVEEQLPADVVPFESVSVGDFIKKI